MLAEEEEEEEEALWRFGSPWPESMDDAPTLVAMLPSLSLGRLEVGTEEGARAAGPPPPPPAAALAGGFPAPGYAH